MSARVPTAAEIDRLLTRGVADVIVREEVVRLLQTGEPLRLKQGFDPSAPDIHLGHVVGLRKLRQFQELGHTVVLIVGDWTAQIGDPSGKSATRPMLTADEVARNAQSYLDQFFKIVDERKTEVRRQTEWYDGFDLTDVIKLTRKFTVAQLLRRDDFAKRYEGNQPIAVTELLYPLLQAYDSVVVRADIEFGGADQRFNNLLGRELQQIEGTTPPAGAPRAPPRRLGRRAEDGQEPGQLHRRHRPAGRDVRQDDVGPRRAGTRLRRTPHRPPWRGARRPRCGPHAGEEAPRRRDRRRLPRNGGRRRRRLPLRARRPAQGSPRRHPRRWLSTT